MSGSAARLQAIEAVTKYQPITEPLSFSKLSASEFFGANVFNRAAMKARLPKPVYKSLMKTIDTASALETSIGNHSGATKLEHAEHYCHTVLPAMAAVRKTADTLEGTVADDLWPLATYQEMLFIK